MFYWSAARRIGLAGLLLLLLWAMAWWAMQ